MNFLVYIFVALCQTVMQMFAKWHHYQLKKSDPLEEANGINKIVKITGSKSVGNLIKAL